MVFRSGNSSSGPERTEAKSGDSRDRVFEPRRRWRWYAGRVRLASVFLGTDSIESIALHLHTIVEVLDTGVLPIHQVFLHDLMRHSLTEAIPYGQRQRNGLFVLGLVRHT